MRPARTFAVAMSALVVAGIYSLAQSQAAPRNQPASKAAQPAAPDQRGTDQIPLTVKVLPAPDAKGQADKAEHDRKEKAIIEEKLAFETQRIADYTDRLGWFTLLLFCAAVGQAGLFVWQLLYMRKGMRDATIAARAASRSAVATVAQAKTARDTLTNVQRPYVYIFGVERLTTSDAVPAVTPYLEYSVANYGQTPAVIQNIGVGFFSGITPEIPIRVEDDHTLIVSPVMPPGDKRTELREPMPEAFIAEDLGIIVDLATSTTHPIPKLVENEDLFFRVVINYRGPFGGDRETSATWIYRRSVSRFVQLNQQEYTYQT